MSRKSVLAAMFGLVILTGCQSEVMKTRYVTNADGPSEAAENFENTESAAKTPVQTADAAASASAPAVVPAATQDDPVAPQQPAAQQPAASAIPVFAPMEGVKSSGGVSSVPRKGRSAAAGEYIVRKGDTLGKIARRYNTSVSAIIEANNMTERDVKYLRIGKKLVIPGGKAVKKSRKAAVRKRAAAKTTESAAPATAEGGVYIVRAGDFPERIARRHKVKVADLLKANNLTEASSRSLRIGQKLVIPGAAGTGEAAAAPAEKAAPAETAAPAENKEVKDADELASALEKTVSDTAPAAEKNTAEAADEALPEEHINITEDITVKDAAAKYKITEEKLRKLNVHITGPVIPKGELLFVPAVRK